MTTESPAKPTTKRDELRKVLRTPFGRVMLALLDPKTTTKKANATAGK